MPVAKQPPQSTSTTTSTPSKRTKEKCNITLAEDQPSLPPAVRASKLRQVDRSIRKLVGDAVSGTSEDESDSSLTEFTSGEDNDVPAPNRDDYGEEGDDEEWENVLHNFEAPVPVTPSGPSSRFRPTGEDLVLTLDKNNASYVPLTGKKKGASARERTERLWTHAAHIACLTYHGFVRNHWINDKELHEILLNHLDSKWRDTIVTFNTKSVDVTPMKGTKRKTKGKQKTAMNEQNDLEKETAFRLYLRDLMNFWKTKFTPTARGLRKRGYRGIGPQTFSKLGENAEGESIANLKAFRQLARDCEGSRDVGVQLYTALLRALGFEARLVFSLCPLGFGFSKVETADEDNLKSFTTPAKDANASKKHKSNSSDDNSVDGNSSNEGDGRYRKKRKIIEGKALAQKNLDKDLKYPTFWTEVYSSWTRTWYPVDPVVLKMNAFEASSFSDFEPRGKAALDSKQQLSYVVAYNADRTARDVTIRYLAKKVFPGKTKGYRLPVFEDNVYDDDGYLIAIDRYDLFAEGIMKCYRPRGNVKTERDIKEDQDLTPVILEKPEKVQKEGVPDSIAAFKTHPEYMLERHLRREEAILPGERPFQTFTVGKGDNAKAENVFKRSSLVICKAVENWHKEGRVIKEGVQPLKLVPSRAVTVGRRQAIEAAKREGDENAGLQGLYSFEQTELWKPPPVVHGRIPKNAFGNADCFVESMIPEGAVHVKLKSAARVAKKLGIDYAEAVTGFEFKKKRAIPFVEGVLVAVEHEELLREAWKADDEERRKREDGKREQLCLGLWRKFLMGLRIVEMVNETYADGKNGESGIVVGQNPFVRTSKDHETQEKAKQELYDNFEPGEGGFIRHDDDDDDDDDEEGLQAGGFIKNEEEHRIDGSGRSKYAERLEDDTRGGFVIEGEEERKFSKILAPSNHAFEQPLSLLAKASNGASILSSGRKRSLLTQQSAETEPDESEDIVEKQPKPTRRATHLQPPPAKRRNFDIVVNIENQAASKFANGRTRTTKEGSNSAKARDPAQHETRHSGRLSKLTSTTSRSKARQLIQSSSNSQSSSPLSLLSSSESDSQAHESDELIGMKMMKKLASKKGKAKASNSMKVTNCRAYKQGLPARRIVPRRTSTRLKEAPTKSRYFDHADSNGENDMEVDA